MYKIREFFWFCSGVHLNTLCKHPTEYNKYFSIGATVFFTALFAALSGGYALWFVFSGSELAIVFAIVFGLLWGLAIFNLDRYIVSSISKRGSRFRQFLQATPRLILAILIAIVIARPLELKIFDKEIRSKLKENYLSDYKSRIDTINLSFNKKYALEITKRGSFQKEADSLYKEINQLRYILNEEFFGEKTAQTSGIKGYGPFAKKKEGVIIEKEKRLAFLRAEIEKLDNFISNRKEIDGLNGQTIPTDAQLNDLTLRAGFADRNRGLSQIAVLRNGKEDGTTATAVLFISLLFVAFECLPVFVKLLSAKGPCDEEIFGREAIRMDELGRDVDKNLRINEAMHEHGIETAIRKMKAFIDQKSEAEIAIEKEAINHWKSQELENIDEKYTDYIK